MKKIILAIIIVWFALWVISSQPISHEAGVLVSEVPKQEKAVAPYTFDYKDCALTVVADYEMKGRVLEKKNYRFDKGSHISPTDLALGWGKMSDESVLESIKTSQYGRFYYWKVKQLPIPRREIEQCSANTHIIPAGKDVESSLRKIRRGDIVHIQGMLVNVKAEKWSWKTSQTRNDTGGGACEIIWVDSLEIITDQIN